MKSFGRLIRIADVNDATIAEYTYDATNKRVSKSAFGITTVFIYDIFGNLIGEYTPSGGLIRDYIYLGNKPIALISMPEGIHIGPIGCPSICTITGGKSTTGSAVNGLLYISPLFALALIRIYRRGKRGRIDLPGLILIAGVVSLSIVMFTKAQGSNENIYYYHTDHLGTPIKLTDSNQAIAWDATYDPFGKANITVSSVTNNLRFPGQYYDVETGLHYNWHRYYWPETGRYLQTDPSINRLFYNLTAKVLFRLIDSLKESPQEFNPYHYVFAQPTNLIDITGLKTCCATFEEYGIQGCCDCSDKNKCGNIWPLSTGTTMPLMGNKPPEPPKGVPHIVGVDGDCIIPGGGCGGPERVPASNCKVYPFRFASTL